MNEKKKDFMFFPEWGWMIITGLLLAILVLMDVVPGHAEEVTPIPTPGASSPRYNYATILYCPGNSVKIKAPDNSYIDLPSPYEYYVNDDDEALDRLRLDYIRALDSMFDFIPASEMIIYYVSDGTPAATLNFLRSVLDNFDVYFKYDISESDPFYEDLFNTNIYTLTSVPCGPYNIGVYKKNSLVVPTPTPTPDPSVTDSFGFIGYFTYNSIYYYVEVSGSNIFKSVTLDINDSDVASAMTSVGTTDPNTTSGKSAYLINTYSSGSSINWGGPYSYLYFTGDNVTVNVWRMSSSLISEDVEYIKANYSYVTLSPDSLNTSGSPYFMLSRVGELNCLIFNYDVYRNTGTCTLINDYGYNIDVLESYSSNYKYFNNSVQLKKAYAALLTRSEEPVPTQDPVASPTPEPLPTSSESIHVILPSGTPTPTPPFFVPGGSDGGTGSGSPGSIGSGLSSQQTSGILEYWSSFVSDNPAMLFLTSTFQALPQELLYPLYILLFILLLLAVIRLFVHFSGG